MDLSGLGHLGDFLKAAALGLVEGATEFIPVSSTGHLIIVADWLGFVGENAKVFEVVIQLGAILAIVWLYRADLARALGPHRAMAPHRLLTNLGIAFLPAAAVGVLTHGLIKRYLFNPITVAVALILGGLAILVIERVHAASRIPKVSDMSPRTALAVGLAQVLSLIPGVSRSGATIMGAYCMGLTRKAATEFSFFLAIPTMVAASAFDLFENRDTLSAANIPVFAIGFVVAFLSAAVVVRAFVGFVARRDFTIFAWYRVVLGVLLLLWYRYRGG